MRRGEQSIVLLNESILSTPIKGPLVCLGRKKHTAEIFEKVIDKMTPQTKKN